MSSRSAQLHAWRFPINERWICAATSIEPRTPRLGRDGAEPVRWDRLCRAARQAERDGTAICVRVIGLR
jgi:hypothetical protein